MKEAGVLCPVFSLPGDYGIGDFGPAASDFLNILHGAGVTIWQVLPLNPLGYGHSPYQPLSSFAGETSFIDLKSLFEDGLIASLPDAFRKDSDRVDYEAVRAFKEPFFDEAFRTFSAKSEKPADYEEFIQEDWAKPYAVFAALKRKNGNRPWTEWDTADKQGYPFENVPEALRTDVLRELFLQYEFRLQWLRILAYAHALGIRVMGDLPIYVGGDSLDVYGDREEFLLDSEGYPTSVAGVPPDYFSETGQRWGNPIYDWEKMEQNHFRFWRNRMKGASKLYDLVRIDHFLAFNAFWKIPAASETAAGGEWVPGPKDKVFEAILPEIEDTEIVVEDLGLVSPAVYELRDRFGFPGMNVIIFTMFNPDFRMRENMISYTGTHDNDTAEGYYESLSEHDRARFDEVLEKGGIDLSAGTKAEQFVKYAMTLPTDTVIVPVQDVLSLKTEARINVPGIVDNVNWTWKMSSLSGLLTKAGWLKETVLFGKKEEQNHGNN